MLCRILTFSLIFTCAGASLAVAESAQEKELKEKIKKYCGDHQKYVKKGGSKSECNNQDNANLARKLNALAKESEKECVKTVKFFLETKVDFERIVNDGTRNAENLRAKVDATEGLNINQLHTIQEESVKSLYTSAQKANASIRSSYESHHKRHDVLSSLEKTYEKLKNEIGYHHDEQNCKGQERKWYGVEAYHLEEEMETLRESVAKNMQVLTKLYQQNLVALGASKSQALTLARDLVKLESMNPNELPKPDGVELEAPNKVSVRNDGLLEGAERGTIADTLDRTLGRNRPYEKEWQEVKCPEGVDAPGCWERGYKAKESKIDDATLAAFSGKLSPGQSTSDPTSGPQSGAQSSFHSLVSAQQEAESLSRYTKLSPAEFEFVKNAGGNSGTVEIDGKRYEDVIIYRDKEGLDTETHAYVKDGDGYRHVTIDNDKAKILVEASGVQLNQGVTAVTAESQDPLQVAVDNATKDQPDYASESANSIQSDWEKAANEDKERLHAAEMQRAHDEAERELASMPKPQADKPKPAKNPYSFEDKYKAEKAGRENLDLQAGPGEAYPQYVRDQNGNWQPNRQLASDFDRQLTQTYGSSYSSVKTSNESTLALQKWVNSKCVEIYGGSGTTCGVTEDGVYGSRTTLQLYQLLNNSNPQVRDKVRREFQNSKF